ncbi:MAG: SpoIIIAH-like family protein [Lachnospiraceae bacterium]|nr:SpoIIIAH-like family protein [Lachnospiraceae bacterium]MDY4068338.1 SpoIIIAH-like family protein [Lachnospiraceae bacterium]
MKNVLKKNQIMITALAIMIAVAGYLNFAGTKLSDEELLKVSGKSVVSENDEQVAEGEVLDELENFGDYDSAALEISDEDTDMEAASADVTLEEAGLKEIESLDTDDVSETPGEAVFTSSTNVNTLESARLMKEQTRAKNKETLLDIINSAEISEAQKTGAVEEMIALTDIAEKETAAEILLEAKGFEDVVVSISDEGVDVVVKAQSLTDAQRAQIEDIVQRKTGTSPENIIISPVN